MRTFEKFLVFLAVNLMVCSIAGFLLTDPSVVRIYLDDIHENKYDTLIIGTSHGETGFDPYIMSEGLNTEAFNASRRLMPVVDLYYLLKTANCNETVRTVYYELDPAYWNSVQSINTHDDTCMLRHAGLKDRVEYAVRYLWDENYNYALFNYFFDVKTIKKVPAILRSKLLLGDLEPDDKIRGIYEFLNISENFEYMGRGFRYGRRADALGMTDYELFTFTEELISQDYLDAFADMAAYCRERDIRLVCVVSALPAYRLQRENYGQAHEYFAKLCKKHDVEFYDMNYLKPGLLQREAEDYTDIDGHMMGPLAQRQTEVLIDLVKADDKASFFVESYDQVLKAL